MRRRRSAPRRGPPRRRSERSRLEWACRRRLPAECGPPPRCRAGPLPRSAGGRPRRGTAGGPPPYASGTTGVPALRPGSRAVGLPLDDGGGGQHVELEGGASRRRALWRDWVLLEPAQVPLVGVLVGEVHLGDPVEADAVGDRRLPGGSPNRPDDLVED